MKKRNGHAQSIKDCCGSQPQIFYTYMYVCIIVLFIIHRNNGHELIRYFLYRSENLYENHYSHEYVGQ